METKNFKSKGSLSIVRSYYFPQNKKPNILQQKKNESVPTIKISKKEESFNRTACFFDPSTWDTSSKKEKKITKENGSLHFFKNPSEDEDGLKKITNNYSNSDTRQKVYEFHQHELKRIISNNPIQPEMHDFSSKNQNIYNLKYIHPVYNENSPFTANPQKLQEKSFEYFHQNKIFLKIFSKSQCNIQKTLNISQEKKNVKKIPISHKRISGSLNELINFYQKNQKGLSKILEKLDTKENHKTQIHESLLRNTTKFFVKTKEEFQKNNVINIPSRMDKCANPNQTKQNICGKRQMNLVNQIFGFQNNNI